MEITSLFNNSKTQQPRDFSQRKLNIDLSQCRYELLRVISKEFHWKISEKQSQTYNIKWSDHYIDDEDLKKMQPYQKINHFPGSSNLCKKNQLAHHLQQMQKIFPVEYDFFPITFVLPFQSNKLQAYMDENKNDIFIAKPEAQSQGKGIYLFKKFENIQKSENTVVQKYLSNPLLIDNLKFDLRIYALVKSLEPLKVFVFKEGIARFATSPFQKPKASNLSNQFMHLTNYSINKKNPEFQQNNKDDNNEKGHKRSMSSVFQTLEGMGIDVGAIRDKIHQLILKTISSVQPIMNHSYKINRPKGENLDLCFEILGFDIMLDSNNKPYLLEVNHSPSFGTDSKLDYDIKKELIQNTLVLVNPSEKDKKKFLILQKNNNKPSTIGQMLQKNKTYGQEKIFYNSFIPISLTPPNDVNIYTIGAQEIWDNKICPKKARFISISQHTRAFNMNSTSTNQQITLKKSQSKSNIKYSLKTNRSESNKISTSLHQQKEYTTPTQVAYTPLQEETLEHKIQHKLRKNLSATSFHWVPYKQFKAPVKKTNLQDRNVQILQEIFNQKRDFFAKYFSPKSKLKMIKKTLFKQNFRQNDMLISVNGRSYRQPVRSQKILLKQGE